MNAVNAVMDSGHTGGVLNGGIGYDESFVLELDTRSAALRYTKFHASNTSSVIVKYPLAIAVGTP
jgi:hypothetical protein